MLKFQTSGAQSVAAFLDPFSYARLFQAMERQNMHVPVLGHGEPVGWVEVVGVG